MSSIRKLFLFLIFASQWVYGQAWSGVLASNRAIDWGNAGLPAAFPDGETTPNPWTPPTRTQCGATLTPTGADTAQINNAITGCAAGHYVLLGPGTFTITSNIILATNNVTLRGSGAASTKITGGGVSIGGGLSWGGATLLTANPAKGATSVTVASAPSAGRLAALEECDDGFTAGNANFTHFGSGTVCTGSSTDPVGVWVCGYSTACNSNGGSNANPHVQAQVVWIPTGGVSGNTVNFTTGVYMPDWTTTRAAALTWLSSTGVVGAGFEDFTVEGGIGFQGTYACWMKGVRIVVNSLGPIMTHQFDDHSLIANSYIVGLQGGPNAELIQWGSDSGEQAQSDFLFINNIIEGGFAIGSGAQVDQVYAYNYFYTSGNSGWVENDEFQHHPGTSFILREGNQAGNGLDDETWGTHNLNSFFRNWYSCSDAPMSVAGAYAIDIGGWARFENIVGNVLGSPACSTAGSAYNVTIRVNGPTVADASGLTTSSLMRWGNYVTCTGGNAHCGIVNWDSTEVPSNLASFGSNATPYQNAVPSNHNLPASFFMNSMTAHPSGGTGLGWWKVCTSWTTFPTVCASYTTQPMPPVGPDVTGAPNMSGHAWDIPAALGRANLPADTNYSTPWGNIRQFDERMYQTDTSSVGPPSVQFLIGDINSVTSWLAGAD